MINFLLKALGLGGGAVVDQVLDKGVQFAKIFAGDKSERDREVARIDQASVSNYAAEWTYRQSRTWFDVLVDGVNRIMRPAITGLTLHAVFIWPWIDQLGWERWVKSLALVPSDFWLLVASVWGFWMTSRLFKDGFGKNMTLSKDQKALAAQLKAEDAEAAAQADLERSLRDDTRAMSNRAIEQWNRQRQAKAS